ncbi:hypothetical protein SAICODRAFT_79853 [Saitoella complicata NRRL Y-17804]|uniref:Sugar phosphate transporter domain-containing protein n=1 Tax=Saitoella complicata (strain BCRC 22490 / CBS 7301 / JCM 7358 / NBRC 10748 / NRRL Y-17804) TaxID=698492 RepID=A0A0E9NMP0_SAICN|nr:uncharacterized protein SAICODRAFT_79853 [Saitoella complicata NRRL Y-17804]ODQ53521.1 hypothetical protein SAICODRAFT_79853 [Saitoella complicata NRRL Y-17804]GAO51068.1 hypothetical protein G7K_5180-t1 [Saitoella complicata NRRL Y-17804]
MAADQQPSKLKVAATILFHSSSAILVTLTSKHALTTVNSPSALLLMQYLVAVGCIAVVGMPLGWLKGVSSSWRVWRSFYPLALARLVGVLAKTYCLAAVNASFYQIARGLLLPFTLILGSIFLAPKPTYSPHSLLGAGLVMLGFVFGVVTDLDQMQTSTIGVALGVGSSLTTAVETIVVKIFLGKREGETGVFSMIFMTNIMAFVTLLPIFVFTGEYASLVSLSLTSPLALRSFLHGSLITGLSSFLLTVATFTQISVTSPTTHMIVTAARGVAQSLLAIVVLNEPNVGSRYLGMAAILGGSGLYAWGKTKKAVIGGGGRGSEAQYEQVRMEEIEEKGKGKLVV